MSVLPPKFLNDISSVHLNRDNELFKDIFDKFEQCNNARGSRSTASKTGGVGYHKTVATQRVNLKSEIKARKLRQSIAEIERDLETMKVDDSKSAARTVPASRYSIGQITTEETSVAADQHCKPPAMMRSSIDSSTLVGKRMGRRHYDWVTDLTF